MTKDKSGNPIFQKGRKYTPVMAFTPLWMPGIKATCLETAEWRYGDGIEEHVIKDGKGLFTLGDDSRFYVASEQFEEA